MESLNNKLTKKAEAECQKLYYIETQKMVKTFMETFHLNQYQMLKNPILASLWNMQYSSDEGEKVLAEIIPIYTENYLDSFIKKVEEVQEMIENHDHE